MNSYPPTTFAFSCDRGINLQNLKEITTLLFAIDVDFFIFYGTLLGYHREKNIISYDNDIDIMVDERDRCKIIELTRLLKKPTIRKRYGLQSEFNSVGFSPVFGHDRKELLQLVSTETGSLVDIYFYKNNPDKDYITEPHESTYFLSEHLRIHPTALVSHEEAQLNFEAKIPKKIIFPLKVGAMQDIAIKIPRNVDACCRFVYGDSYMTPKDKEWESDLWPDLTRKKKKK